MDILEVVIKFKIICKAFQKNEVSYVTKKFTKMENKLYEIIVYYICSKKLSQNPGCNSRTFICESNQKHTLKLVTWLDNKKTMSPLEICCVNRMIVFLKYLKEF